MRSQLNSVFSKLIRIYIITFLLITLGLLLFKVLSTSHENTHISKRNLQFFAEILTDRIGSPPDLPMAETITLQTNLELSISGPGLDWSTGGEEEEPEFCSTLNNSPLRFLFPHMLDYTITIQRGAYIFEYTDFHSDFRISAYGSILLVLSTILSFLFNYLSVHRLLNPLHKMTEVALELGIHHCEKRVNPSGKDELAILGREMDNMADRIEDYIVSMHDLIAAVSHEFRTPLTRIRVALEFIDDASLKESLNEEVNAMNDMIENILEQNRLRTQPGSLYREYFELPQWLDNFCRSCKKRSLPIRFIPPQEPDSASFRVLMDKSRLELAMRSIMGNAHHHAPGSPVTVSLEKESGQFIISVEDEGPGIPEQLIPRLGEPFLLADSSRTGSRKTGGFGLGFSIIKAVAEAHGGSMTVQNTPRKGARIVLTFPLEQKQNKDESSDNSKIRPFLRQ